MPDRSSDTKKTAIKVAMGAALGGALGITAALRNEQAVGSRQSAVESNERAPSGQDEPPSPALSPHAAHAAQRAPAPAVLSPDHPDWEPLPTAHLPRPTYWPVVLAIGVMFLAWGIVTTIIISIIGVALLALGLGGWIGELRHGR